MAFTKLFVTIQKQRPRVKRKRRKKNVRNRLLSRLSFVRGGETLLVCCMCTAVPSSSSVGCIYSHSTPFLKNIYFCLFFLRLVRLLTFPREFFFLHLIFTDDYIAQKALELTICYWVGKIRTRQKSSTEMFQFLSKLNCVFRGFLLRKRIGFYFFF
jgi:hypothetical protein